MQNSQLKTIIFQKMIKVNRFMINSQNIKKFLGLLVITIFFVFVPVIITYYLTILIFYSLSFIHKCKIFILHGSLDSLMIITAIVIYLLIHKLAFSLLNLSKKKNSKFKKFLDFGENDT